MLKHGEYVGSDNELKGHCALLKQDQEDGEGWLVQFDTVTHQGKTCRAPEVTDVPVGVQKYMFGWHPFPKSDFFIEEEPTYGDKS